MAVSAQLLSDGVFEHGAQVHILRASQQLLDRCRWEGGKQQPNVRLIELEVASFLGEPQRKRRLSGSMHGNHDAGVGKPIEIGGENRLPSVAPLMIKRLLSLFSCDGTASNMVLIWRARTRSFT